MSEYEKDGVSNVNDNAAGEISTSYPHIAGYNATRPSQDPMYLPYSQARLVGSQLQPSSSTYDRNGGQMNYGASSLYQSRANDNTLAAHSNCRDFGLRRAPEVKSYNPQQGNKGSHIYVYLRSDSDLLASPALIASLTFAAQRVHATLTRLETHGSLYEYVVTTDAPSFIEVGSPTSRVYLRLQLQEQSGVDAGLIDVGYFKYLDSRDASRNNNVSDHKGAPTLTDRSISSQQIPSQTSQNYDQYSYPSGDSLAYPQSLHSVDLDSMQRRFTPYGRSQNQQRYKDSALGRSSSNYSAGPAASHASMMPPTSHASAWSPSSYSVVNQSIHSPVMDATRSFQFSDISATNLANPPLIRTSTLQQTASPGSVGSGTFNPCITNPQKAVLRLRGNLNAMTENWTPDEWAMKRRLVQFWRSQNKSTINSEFVAVTPGERQSNSICISCIWWEERQECFITSVDTIYLLESLVAVRFSVEEKNRVRRNLEGFHPLTVSKAKQDSQEFFKVIMGFPNPKPRNIEKDVKVFPWDILTHALKKIIGKYSASYPSKAGALSTPLSSAYGGYQSDQGDPYTQTLSRSVSNSTASSAYTQTLESNTMSPRNVLHGFMQFSEALTSLSSPPYSATSVSSLLDYAHSPFDRMHTSYPDGVLSIPSLPHSYTAPVNNRRKRSRPTSIEPQDRSRYVKRRRSNTSGSTMYAMHDTNGLSLKQFTRSVSEQPKLPVSLPSLATTCTAPPSTTQYASQTSSTTQSASSDQTRQSTEAIPTIIGAPCGSYDFSCYTETRPTSANPDSAQAKSYQQGPTKITTKESIGKDSTE